ncbi:MAG: signal peptidase II [Bdellovibrionales bacterium]|nr:signal peptidase II [Bdellovibrionales bacterium]
MSQFTKTTFSILLIGITAFLDQMTKGFVRTQIELNGTKNIIPNFFDLTHLHNPGVAFGFLGGANPSLRLGVFLLSYILVGVFVISRIRTTSSKLELAALSLLVGGAVGFV